MNKVTGRFFASCRNVKRRSRHPVCRVSFCVFVWSLARRSSHRLCRPEAARRQEGQAVKRKNGFLSDRGGLRYRRSSPETAAKISPLRPGSVSEPAVQEQHTPDPQPVRVKEHWQLLPICQQLHRVQRPGVHRRHRRWQGARPMRYRTDRGKSKKRQVSGRTAKR